MYHLYFTVESHLNSWPNYGPIFFWHVPRPLKNMKNIRKMHPDRKETLYLRRIIWQGPECLVSPPYPNVSSTHLSEFFF